MNANDKHADWLLKPTANQLADELDWHWDNDCRSPAISKSADMLRQQQAEIEALRAENKFFKDLMGDVEILRRVQEK